MVLDNGSEVYFEDNTFVIDSNTYYGNMVDCQNGGRYVFCYNTVTGDAIFDHGYDKRHSTSCIEVTSYQNTFNLGVTTGGQSGILYRGATGVDYQKIPANWDRDLRHQLPIQ